MGNLVKVLTGILGVLAVIACLTTIGVIGYSLSGAGDVQTDNSIKTVEKVQEHSDEEAVPGATPDSDEETKNQPVSLAGHTHDYKESVNRKATCYQAGRLQYTCSVCGDTYYVDVLSTGHVADDWEIVREPSVDKEGLQVKKCIYCDEIVAQETIPYTKSGAEDGHVHEYRSNVEREPTCILAGLRKYTCSCGSFYTEKIPAPGHIATDWTVAEEATSTMLGREQRTCTVCGVVLDSRPVTATPSPSPSAQATPTSAAATTGSPSSSSTPTPQPTASPSPTPTATPHTHNYTSYVLKEANCSEMGIRSFVCSCGSSYAEEIEPDPNRHNYKATVVPATETANGYTLYWCTRCNDTYMDNYTPMLK